MGSCPKAAAFVVILAGTSDVPMLENQCHYSAE
jgi:NCAIR mutase (PurE)-related protein